MSLLSLHNVYKRFGAVEVLHGVSLNVEAGEVVGLVGDNGAGKSVMMKTVTGLYGVSAGTIQFDGQDITGRTPGERRELGIEMIYQDLSLAPQFDVSSNIFLGREPVKRLFGVFPGFVDKRQMDKDARVIIDKLGAHIPSLNRAVGNFSGGQRQTVAIARALTFEPKLVIMDEPTAALAVREVQGVLDLIRRLRDDGIGIILISHRLNDVLSVTDRIQVLRHGRLVAHLQTSNTNMAEVVQKIVGGDDLVDAAAHESAG
jgi:simple sugar transport system ATP-binding protein